MEAYTGILVAADAIKHSKKTVALTGAGISVGSGLMTFRGRDGLWKRFDPAEVGSIETFHRYPERFWQFAREVGPQLLASKPNPAHLALAQLQRDGLLDWIITQNVDGLHQKAGAKNVIELHGSVSTTICTNCGSSAAAESLLSDLEASSVPACSKCGGQIKPDIVLFGEKLPEREYSRAVKEVQSCTLLLTVGTTMEVYPAAELPELARRKHARIINVNPYPSEADQFADFTLFGPSEEILPSIVHALKLLV